MKIETIDKLLAMIERGSPNESKVATEKLNKLLEKHGLTLESLNQKEEKKIRWFSYRNTYEQMLIDQIAYAFFCATKCYSSKLERRKRGFDLTEKEFVDFQVYLDAYKKGMKKTLEMAYTAFLHANKIFPPNSGNEKYELTEQDKQMLGMSEHIEAQQIFKQIEGV